MKYDQRRIAKVFSYHWHDEAMAPKFQAMRKAGFELADCILANTPSCPDQTIAIGRVREAIMFANAALAIPQD